ncbi:MAG: hypothetical protein M1816_005693 [Peltula sp. TS41687]|nr:MAG: hypothetical protein M1816_005693 [Peltula sp. TS41687]
MSRVQEPLKLRDFREHRKRRSPARRRRAATRVLSSAKLLNRKPIVTISPREIFLRESVIRSNELSHWQTVLSAIAQMRLSNAAGVIGDHRAITYLVPFIKLFAHFDGIKPFRDILSQMRAGASEKLKDLAALGYKTKQGHDRKTLLHKYLVDVMCGNNRGDEAIKEQNHARLQNNLQIGKGYGALSKYYDNGIFFLVPSTWTQHSLRDILDLVLDKILFTIRNDRPEILEVCDRLSELYDDFQAAPHPEGFPVLRLEKDSDGELLKVGLLAALEIVGNESDCELE